MPVFEFFDEYGQRRKKITLALDIKECSWFKIYLFSKENIELVEELNFQNALLVRHRLLEHDKFSVYVDRSVLPEKPLAFFLFKKDKKTQHGI